MVGAGERWWSFRGNVDSRCGGTMVASAAECRLLVRGNDCGGFGGIVTADAGEYRWSLRRDVSGRCRGTMAADAGK